MMSHNHIRLSLKTKMLQFKFTAVKIVIQQLLNCGWIELKLIGATVPIF